MQIADHNFLPILSHPFKVFLLIMLLWSRKWLLKASLRATPRGVSIVVVPSVLLVVLVLLNAFLHEMSVLMLGSVTVPPVLLLLL